MFGVMSLLRQSALVGVATGGVAPAMVMAQGASVRTMANSARSHSASKKRFFPRAGGGLVYKPSGRRHGMHRHSRNRNRAKGAAVVIERNQNADMWKRLRASHVKVRGKRILKPKKNEFSDYEIKYKFSNQITSSKGLMSVVAPNLTKDMAPQVVGKVKKVQWRVVE